LCVKETSGLESISTLVTHEWLAYGKCILWVPGTFFNWKLAAQQRTDNVSYFVHTHHIIRVGNMWISKWMHGRVAQLIPFLARKYLICFSGEPRTVKSEPVTEYWVLCCKGYHSGLWILQSKFKSWTILPCQLICLLELEYSCPNIVVSWKYLQHVKERQSAVAN
jgi:hypothetical protein